MIEALRDAHATPADDLMACGEWAAERAREFTWARSGREMVDILKQIPRFLPPGR
jgi:hypothetical protein